MNSEVTVHYSLMESTNSSILNGGTNNNYTVHKTNYNNLKPIAIFTI